VLELLDPLLRAPLELSAVEFDALVTFVRDGLLDPNARPQRLQRFIPENLPSGLPNLVFQFQEVENRHSPLGSSALPLSAFE
jgi:hypothetical protein